MFYLINYNLNCIDIYIGLMKYLFILLIILFLLLTIFLFEKVLKRFNFLCVKQCILLYIIYLYT